MSAHFAISSTAARRVHPTGRVVWWGKATRHNSLVHSTAGKLAVAGNGRGINAGCLQKYRKRWGLVRMATYRSAWPHELHEASATAAPGEVTETTDLGVSSAGSLLVRQHIVGVRYRSGRHRWGFRRNG